MAIAFAAIFIQFFIIAIAYMVGTAFNLVQLKRWTKSEFAQAVASVFLVAILFSVTVATNESVGVLMMQDITERAAGGVLMPGAPEGTIVRANPFQAAYAYLRN
ncbi:MAG: hypothetical protein NT157_05155, partial [Candidatus Micrarchaeota archaeon]|nr:hypothetical protein [Candidatus Micrarchaeota archaeon]